MRAWYFENSARNAKEPCIRKSAPEVTIKDLQNLQLDVIKFDPDNYENDAEFIQLKKTKKYDYQDIVTVNGKTMANYDTMSAAFLREHIHNDDEARAVLEGCGYFDVKDQNDKWIRIEVSSGDLLVVPGIKGHYYRKSA